MKRAWDKIWDERGEKYPSENPLDINGFDQGFGKISDDTFEKILNEIRQELDIKKTDTILDVGCGCGVYVDRLKDFSMKTIGVDLSSTMIQKAKALFPNSDFISNEPIDLIFKDQLFEKVFSHSVFQYFENYIYAEKVLTEMVRVTKSNGKILILDIMDIEKKDEYTKFRFFNNTIQVWKSSIEEEVNHLYFSKEFFINLKSKLGLKSVIIKDREIEGYKNSFFRFNVILEK